MLFIDNIKKQYVTGDLTQDALNGVSFNLRDNEFVAVLGQSGSGKTTLLNIIGGLDRYDSGDIVINNISTKKYTDRDWDSYRNHTVGFVFQSYNLIPHQSILSNVELALTISGISKKERREKAKAALHSVGLGDQLHKKPNQMSGGQMQRVAIARALVNDPDILLADEPTGALDSETSIQVMELLKEVAKDRLVVMVTHNPELADTYANRIIMLHDGKIVSDSNPFSVEHANMPSPEHKNMGKASMSFLTSLSLSFNNLRTKKARTFLTAFAGSIGIIGIALILSISTGVNDYIEYIQKDTMTSYPITIDAQSFDLSSMMQSGREQVNDEVSHDKDGIYSNASGMEMAQSVSTSLKENNLTEFKKYIENPDSEIAENIGDNGIVYSYDTKFDIYTYDENNEMINTSGSTFESSNTAGNGADTGSTVNDNMNGMGTGMGAAGEGGIDSLIGGMTGGSTSENSNFQELLSGTDGSLVSQALMDNYDVLYGSWPSSYDQVVLALDENNEIATQTLYELGLLPADEYKEILSKMEAGEEVTFEEHKWSYEDIMNQTFYLIPASDRYIENGDGTFTYIQEEDSSDIINDAIELKISGVVRPIADASYVSVSGGLGYTKALSDYIIEHTNESTVVKAQEASPDTNVLNNEAFASEAGEGESETEGGNALAGTSSYDDNMVSFGVVSTDAPTSISIYADSFEAKDSISEAIDDYNQTAEEEDKITYTDFVGLLMSSVTTIVNVISYVLVAFVGVSLIVSSIMIGIITFISVLERTKEIGVLRAIGASKRNISQVFNAETFIIGIFSGLLGVGITLHLLIPINAVLHAVLGMTTVNAALPVAAAVILVILSVLLTLLAGLIPAKQAARKDPVIALRSE